jgi:hypothetical protein
MLLSRKSAVCSLHFLLLPPGNPSLGFAAVIAGIKLVFLVLESAFSDRDECHRFDGGFRK